MTKAKLKSAVGLVFGMSFALVASDGPVGKTVEIEGYVHSARDAIGAPVGPVAGAVVSTSLDSTTAVTDRSGRFHLRTSARVSGDEFYIVTVESGGIVLRQRTMSAQMRHCDYVLSELWSR